jgi:hypothetical protein
MAIQAPAFAQECAGFPSLCATWNQSGLGSRTSGSQTAQMIVSGTANDFDAIALDLGSVATLIGIHRQVWTP